MKMTVPIMGPNTDFKPWERNFLTFMSLKAKYLIPQLAIRESCVWLDEAALTYAYTLLLHATSENKRVEQTVKCISAARMDCATVAWDILCDRVDNRSFADSLSVLDNLMIRQRPGKSLTNYVHFMRKSFDDYNELCDMIDGSAAIHPHNLGFMMLRGISSNDHFGMAKQCVINAFNTKYRC
jgi:spore cortex formation protein SpoVR/YcgB (stage V sporulation)